MYMKAAAKNPLPEGEYVTIACVHKSLLRIIQ
jgi:hypothetical protein